MPSKRTERLAAAFTSIVPVGASLAIGEETDATIIGVTARDEDVFVTFRWMAYPYVLGVAVRADTHYAGSETADAWASEAITAFEEDLGTGLIMGASRHQHDGIIELGDRVWPADARFYSSSVGPDDAYAWHSIAFFERDGFDTSIVRGLRADGTLISWERSYVNNRYGSPFVGHAAVARIDSDTARLVYCSVAPEVPETVALELCFSAAHAAAWHGARRIITDVDNPTLEIMGFRSVDGERQLATDFLDVDHDAAARLLAGSRRWRRPEPTDRGSVHRVEVVDDRRLKG